MSKNLLNKFWANSVNKKNVSTLPLKKRSPVILFLYLFIYVLSPFAAQAQVPVVSGIVVDETGQTMPGINVGVKGTTVGQVTDNQGHFSLKVPVGKTILVFSYVGYLVQEIELGGRSTLTVKLVPENKNLSEVVVVGYGSQKKSDVTGAISSLSAKDFKDQPVTRLDQALQGRVAGVQVISSSGAPGGDVKIRVRGSNSILGDNNPLYVIDGFIGGDFNNLNPDDIANIEVLKDASSTAIYGSRGANGVVLITTKKGGLQKPEITLSSIFSISEIAKRYDLLNAADYAAVVNERAAEIGTDPTFTADQIAGYRAKGGTDWQDQIFRTAPTQEYKVGASGGSETSQYLLSLDYLNQKGIILNSDYKRYAIRSNLNSKVSDQLAIRLNLSAMRRENLNNQGGSSSPVAQALVWAPTTPVYNSAGNFTINDPVGSIFQNPVAIATDQTNRLNNSSVNLIGGANYHFFKDLSLDVSFGVDYQNLQGANYSGPTITTNIPTASRTSAELLNLQNTNTLNYSHTFNKVHSLNVTAVFEQQKYTSTMFNANATGLTFYNLGPDNLSLSTTQSAGSSYSRSNLISYLGRINYGYKDKYLLTVSLRRDGSSKFQPIHQQSTFPSVGLGWKLSEEPFIKNLQFFDQLKLRGSWGKTGSQAISPYATLPAYLSDLLSAATSFNSAGVSSGIILGNAANPDLKWETTVAKDLGLDLSILKGRLNFSADAYVKHTSDLLLSLPLPAFTGGGNIVSNVGRVKNSGIEFSLSGNLISSSRFSWTSAFNMSFQKNLVENIGDLKNIFSATNAGGGLSPQPEFNIVPGQSLGSYWGLKYLGTWKPTEAAEAAKFNAKPGDSRYEDLDGDHTITGSDFQIIGNGLPKYSLGWNNTFTYRNISLNVFFQSLLGFDKQDYSYGRTLSANSESRQATNVAIKDRYIPGVNETSDIPAFSTTNKDYFQSTRFLEKGSFIRLKNINLSYDFPKGMIPNVGLKVFVGATNLFTITKYKGFDPESSNAGTGSDITQSIDNGSYPNSRTFIAGAAFKF